MALEKMMMWRLVEKYGPNSWAGVVTFRCPNGEALGWVDALQGSAMAGFGGSDRPTAVRVKGQYHGYGRKKAKITAWYKTQREPGKAVLWGRIANRTIKADVIKDTNGKMVQGPDPDGVTTWVVVEGSAILTEPIEEVVLRTATADLNLPYIRSRHNCVNSAPLRNFGNAPAGSLWFWGFPYRRQLGGGSTLWDIDYIFRVSPYRTAQGGVLPWNSGLKSQQAVDMIQKAPVFEIQRQGTPLEHWQALDTLRSKIRLQPGITYYKNADGDWMIGRREPEARRMLRYADFGGFNAMLTW